MVHKCIAVILALFYLLVFTGNIEYYTGFTLAQNTAHNTPMHKASSGIAYIYFLAGASCYCLLFPQKMAERLSPRVGGLKEILLTANFWLIVGYFGAVVSLVVFEVFK